MLRPILTILQLWIGGEGASEAKRLVALAGVLGVVVLSGALTTNLALTAAVFLALQPVMEPVWAAALAAAAALLLATILIAGICWVSGRARRKAAASNAARAEKAVLIGTLASAFLSGIVSGLDRRSSQPRGDQF